MLASRHFLAVLWLGLCAPATAADAPLPQLRAYQTDAAWRQPVPPVRIADNTWHIGTQELATLLIRTDAGAILIDGGLPQAADMLMAHMRELGVWPGDLKLILHSHAHIDHVGALAAIKRATGATLVSNAESAWLLSHGGFDDLHFGDGLVFPPVTADRLVRDGEVIALGDMRLTVHFTPGHTPGSMSWTWSDVRDGKPVRIAYVDSLSAPGYKLGNTPRYPRLLDDYARSFATVRALPCDLLVSPHATRDSGWDFSDTMHPLKRAKTCRQYADEAQRALDAQLAEQRRAGAAR